MDLNIVTGVGPRVGSSFVMQQCKASGLDVTGDKFLNGLLPVEGNPLGYYDLLPWDVPNLTSGVAKVWPLHLQRIIKPVTRLVILKRKDINKQIESCLLQMDREPIKIKSTAVELIDMSEILLHSWLDLNDVDHRSYYTEDLDSNIDDIVKFLGD